MRTRTQIGFGLLIAYVLPGFTLLAALALVYTPLQIWLVGPANESPAVGGVLYVTAASILLGKILNVLRWASLDWILSRTGLQRPELDERLLPDRLHVFEFLVESHYRYFQFYGNMALALPLSLIAIRMSEHSQLFPTGMLESVCFVIEIALLAGSRDALCRYFLRSKMLLGKDSSSMTNGSHPKPDSQKEKPAAQTAAAAGADKPKDQGGKKS